MRTRVRARDPRSIARRSAPAIAPGNQQLGGRVPGERPQRGQPLADGRDVAVGE